MPRSRKARLTRILEWFDEAYPNATCALTHGSPWELLVATILSAQCTDKRVNMVTPGLFAKYPTVEDFAAVRPEVLAQDIKPTGFFNNKAKSIVGAAKMILRILAARCQKQWRSCVLCQAPPENGERRPRYFLRCRNRNCRRYSCCPAVAAVRPHEAERPCQD